MNRKTVVASPELPPVKGPYSAAIKADGFIFVSGLGPVDPTSGAALAGSIEAQTNLVLDNLARVLKAAGSSLDHVVKTTVYLRDMNDFAQMNSVYATYFPKDPPARTTIQAARLPMDFGVEIDAIAMENETL